MTDWIEHDGKDIPFHHSTMVWVRQRAANESIAASRALDLHHRDYNSGSCWVWKAEEPKGTDIVAYRVEGKVIR